MKLLLYIFLILQLIIVLYLLQPFVLLVIHYLKKAFTPYRSPATKPPKIEKDFDFAAIVTAHMDPRFIPPLLDSLLKQNYIKVHVYIVADDCDIKGWNYNDERVSLLKPENAFHSKIKSIQYAVDNFVSVHDALVIFDSDNLVHPNYFYILNKYFQQGYRAVQTQMLSKNTSTVYSKLDSIGHIYHTFLERQMRMELGLSAHILGLGIAVDYQLYKDIMYKDRLGGFDKKLQADIVLQIPQLAYAEEAYVYDEKVDDGTTLEKQRVRWLFTYFHYFKNNFAILLAGLKRLNFNLIYFGFIVLRPPLIMVLGAAIAFMLINLLFTPIYFWVWVAILFIYALSFALIIITQSRQAGMAKALVFMPAFVLRQAKALLKIKHAGKSFLKTEHHNIVYIEDLLK